MFEDLLRWPLILILVILVVVIVAVAVFFMMRKKSPIPPSALAPSPWAQPPAGSFPQTSGARMQMPPGYQSQMQPGVQPQPVYVPQQPVAFVPPTVERPPLSPASAVEPAPAAPTPEAPPRPQYQPVSSPPTQLAPETSRVSYFGMPAELPRAQPGPAQPAVAQAPLSIAPQPAAPAQPAMPAPAMHPLSAPASGPEMRHFTKKIILIGDGGVGKTTLIRKFVYDMFDDKYIATIGTKVSKKKVVCPETLLDINLMVWDVQGQRNDPLLTRYFTGAEGAFFVCDVTRFQTFENLPEWIKDFESVCGKVPMIILGNKSDLVDNAQFGESELAALAARYNAKAFLTSAKSGANVESSFKDIARAITK